MKLLIMLFRSKYCSKSLLEDITPEKFNYYLTADDKIIDKDRDDVLEELLMDIDNAIEVESPTDDRLKNVDGIIAVRFAL